jgi:hypothetical protein
LARKTIGFALVWFGHFTPIIGLIYALHLPKKKEHQSPLTNPGGDAHWIIRTWRAEPNIPNLLAALAHQQHTWSLK